jgi:hypothetical protein
MKRMMQWLQSLRLRLFQNSVADQYFMRYIAPEIQRAKRLGIPGPDLREMWDRAVEDADHNTGMGAAPRFRNLVDQWHFTHLMNRARDMGMPQYVFEHTWADALRIQDTEHPPLEILNKFLDDWETGNVHLL